MLCKTLRSQLLEVRNLVDETVKRFGRLDVAVNVAGVPLKREAPEERIE
jgi:NAD(P)-dependent dehydrogenase (short-subunit alcohol dehydrogenase family)